MPPEAIGLTVFDGRYAPPDGNHLLDERPYDLNAEAITRNFTGLTVPKSDLIGKIVNGTTMFPSGLKRLDRLFRKIDQVASDREGNSDYEREEEIVRWLGEMADHLKMGAYPPVLITDLLYRAIGPDQNSQYYDFPSPLDSSQPGGLRVPPEDGDLVKQSMRSIIFAIEQPVDDPVRFLRLKESGNIENFVNNMHFLKEGDYNLLLIAQGLDTDVPVTDFNARIGHFARNPYLYTVVGRGDLYNPEHPIFSNEDVL
ncbi:hypothetical protein GF389_04630 [Candidatus Dojkabacteria bacterium]|nr:hypothetical protein [Candidatus Dojkabacteria bacterium]